MSTDRLVTALHRPRELRRLSSLEWEWLIGRARTARLLARLALRMEQEACLEDVPTGPRRHLKWACREWEAQQRALHWDVDFIVRALAAVDTPVVLLKGAAYAMAGLPPAIGRLFSDIDIMVQRERLEDVEKVLRAKGWFATKLDAYDQHFYRTWMHELPPYQHFLRGTVLDVHHTIAPPVSRQRVDADKLFAVAQKLPTSTNLYVLAPTDMLLHSITHLVQEGEFEHGLRDLMDIDDLFRHFGADPAFWPSLLRRAAEHRLGRPLYYAAHQVRRVLGTPMPGDFTTELARFAPSGVAHAVMPAIFRAGIASEAGPGNSIRVRFCRWLLYVRGHYLRMPLHLLLPHLMRKAWRRNVAAS